MQEKQDSVAGSDLEKAPLLAEEQGDVGAASSQAPAPSPKSGLLSSRIFKSCALASAVLLFGATQNLPGLPGLTSRHHHRHHCDGTGENGYLAAYRASQGHSKHRAPHHAAEIEEAYLSVPNNESCIAASRSYTGFAHVAGTPGDFRTAVLVKSQWERLLGLPASGRNKHIFDAGSKQSKKALLSKSDDLRVWTDTYYVLLNHPVPLPASKTAVFLKDANGQLIHKAKLAEDPLAEDPTSVHGNQDVPPFHGYSKAGTATGQLVYAHSGTVEDFARLKQEGVDVTGKIVLVRYGGNFRGLKVKAAQDAGAIGVLIYSDPAEDGDITFDKGHLPYPQGPARQPSSLQRGSVQYLSQYPGDPTTPERPSYKDVKREKPYNLPGIPSLPLSYEDALPFLRALNGRGPCIDGWQGGLTYQDVSYCSGPSDGNIQMTNDIVEKILPIWNTYAIIPGHIKDEVVLLGNHRDAWVFGASDPNSGTASVHEVVKGFGHLLKKGWKPLRTIIVASWDAEEYGLVGSTEFGEDYREWSNKVVAYLNLDGAAAGSLYNVRASPSLADLFVNVSNIGVPPPPGHEGEKLPVGPLGSGSDFTVFLQHLGIASSDMGYRRADSDPVYHYHSIYDSEYWMEKYGDPGFSRHVNVAKALGLASIRLADSLVLPLNITRYADELDNYLDGVVRTAKAYNFTDIKFEKLAVAIANIQAAASVLDDEIANITASNAALRDIGCPRLRHREAREVMKKIRGINKRKIAFEKGFVSGGEGLPRRPWYKHLGVAPGYNLGYGATTFPSVTEAMTIAGSKEELDHELQRLEETLKRIAFQLKGNGEH